MDQNGKEIRVFISSTFRDMNQERDLLARQVAPRLSMLCRQRGGILTIIDLRWGITEKEANDNKVLPICLGEIDNCRPYFIGILGERYGETNYDIGQETLGSLDIADLCKDKISITHLEILYGVLDAASIKTHARFFFRDQKYSKKFTGYAETDADKKDKLDKLKRRIKTSPYTYQEYDTPEDFAQKVEAFLQEIIDQRFPAKNKKQDMYEQMAEQHRNYAMRFVPTKMTRRNGVVQTMQQSTGLRKYFAALDSKLGVALEYPILILGEPGSGKSAIVANYMASLKRRLPPQVKFVAYYTASSDIAGNWATLVTYIMKQLAKAFSMEYEIPRDAEQLKEAFSDFLFSIPPQERCFIAIDGIERFTDMYGEPELGWLPYTLPFNVRMFITTTDCKAYYEMRRRSWDIVLGVRPLDEEETREFISRYLEEKRKRLEDDQIRRIIQSSIPKTPANLKMLLDELCVVGKFGQLNDQIDEYSAAGSTAALLEKILPRLEADFDVYQNDMTRDMFKYLYASKSGLSEGELLELLGRENEPLAASYLVRLRAAAGSILSNQDGLLYLSNQHVKDAVEKRYVAGVRSEIHRKLATFYEENEYNALSDTNEISDRCLTALPWHYRGMNAYGKLYAFLSDINVMCRLYRDSKYLLQEYWVELINESYSPEEAYKQYLDHPKELDDAQMFLSDLLQGLGYTGMASKVRNLLISHFEKTKDDKRLNVMVLEEANACVARGEHRRAHDLYHDQMMEALHQKEFDRYHRILVSDGVALELMGDIASAERAYDECIRYFLREEMKKDAYHAMVNKAVILKNKGQLEEALMHLEKSEKICRQSYDPVRLTVVLGNKALICKDMGDYDKAIPIYEEIVNICGKFGLVDTLQLTYGNLGVVYFMLEQYNKALQLQRQKEQICRKTNAYQSLSQALGNIGNIYKAVGMNQAAIDFYQETIAICREHGYQKELMADLCNLAGAYLIDLKIDAALTLLAEQQALCDELDNPSGKITGLLLYANALALKRDSAGARDYANEALSLAQAYGYRPLVMQAQEWIQSIRD